jgi:hypothetical protein
MGNFADLLNGMNAAVLANPPAAVAPSPDQEGGYSPVVENAPQSQPKKPGVFKSMLMNFAQGVGETAWHEYMGDRDLQKQRIGIDQQNANSLDAERDAVTKYRNWQMEQQGQMVTLPNGVQLPYPVAMKVAPELFKQQAADQRNAANIVSREKIASDQHELGKMKLEQMMALGKARMAVSNANAQTARERLQLARERGMGTAMTTAGMKSFDDAMLADKRLEIMKDALDNPNGQNDVAMLFNHIGMTLSAQKGARITNAEIDRAIKTRSLPEDLLAKWDQVQNGKFLSPEQRKQMYDLGVLNRDVMWENARRKARFYGVNREPEQSDRLPALGGSAPKATHRFNPATGKIEVIK